jgi:hypothetical protein
MNTSIRPKILMILSTTAIVDLQRQADGIGNLTYFDPKLITAKLNDYFSISNINIR